MNTPLQPTLPPAAPEPPDRNRRRRLLLYGGGAFAVLFVLFLVLFLYQALHSLPAISSTGLAMQTNSVVLDREGKPFTELRGSENRRPVPLDQIPLHVRNAVLAAEDIRFYEHGGIDMRSLARAVWVNLTTGSFSQGASTITQQLVKVSFLTPEKTLKRKAQEAYMAIQLEDAFSKDQILEMYLNRIYYGHGAHGIQVASRRFFGKGVDQLTVAEGALLAALPRSPSLYSPINHPEDALSRRNTILRTMGNHGMITEEELNAALQVPLPGKLFEDPGDTYPHAAFLDEVIRELTEVHGFSEEEVFQGGLRIHTTLDRRIQAIAEEVMANPANFPPAMGSQPVQGALAVVDHRTGEVRALIGGRDYKPRGFNRATMLQRQPGSTIKPVIVYAPAMAAGYNPESMLTDEPIDINGYAPQNYDGYFRGPVSIRQAAAQSINVPAVLLFRAVGPENGARFARSAGIPLEPQEAHLSLALGGLSHGVSPLQMAGAFGALANLGVYYAPHTVLQVTDPSGRELLEPGSPRQILDPVAAYLTTDMLVTAVNHGTGGNARMGRPVAGKTGTTELPKDQFGNIKGNKDAWFVGYTPELTCAVWMGYDKTDAKNYLQQVYGGSYPAMVFRQVLQRALEGVPYRSFEVPSGAYQRLTGVPWPLSVQEDEQATETPGPQPPPTQSRGPGQERLQPREGPNPWQPIKETFQERGKAKKKKGESGD